MKIVVDRQIPGLVARIEEEFPKAVVVALDGKEIGPETVSDADALIVRTRTRCDKTLLAGSGVKLIGTATIGSDHIDLEWCKANGISVANAPGCNAPAVMQYVAASLERAGFDPKNQTLGVVGKGNIGSMVTRLYRDAGARVLVCDPPRAERGLTDEDYLPLEKLLQESDAVTLHVPYTEQGPHPTRHLITADNLPDSVAILVNSSRGEVVEPKVILQNPESRKLIIDTWPFEEKSREWSNELKREMTGRAFIATPHIAGYSIEGKRRATEAMIDALKGIPYSGPEPRRYNLEDVARSFDPMPLSEALKANPDEFENLRNSHLRPEPHYLTT